MDSLRTLFSLVATSAFLFGCGPLGTGGELSNGGFGYRCTSEGDPTCDDPAWDYLGSGVTYMPSVLAVGARFGVVYDGEAPEDEHGATYAVTVVPASTRMVERSGSELLVTSPGHIALLGFGNGMVADFVHFRAATPTGIFLEQDGISATSLSLPSGTARAVRATVLDEEGSRLAGGVTYTWTSSDESIVQVSAAYGDNEATVSPVAAGQATIQVQVLGLSLDVPVEVTP